MNTPNTPAPLRTPRLELIPATAAMVRADLSDPARFGEILRASVPALWPPELFAEDRERLALELESASAPPAWPAWYWVLEEAGTRTLSGMGGVTLLPSPPEEQGTAMCGYTSIPAFRGRGLATEAMRAIFAWAFAHPSVSRIIGDTFPDLVPSQRVMEKLGMVHTGAGARRGRSAT